MHYPTVAGEQESPGTYRLRRARPPQYPMTPRDQYPSKMTRMTPCGKCLRVSTFIQVNAGYLFETIVVFTVYFSTDVTMTTMQQNCQQELTRVSKIAHNNCVCKTRVDREEDCYSNVPQSFVAPSYSERYCNKILTNHDQISNKSRILTYSSSFMSADRLCENHRCM